MKKRVVLYLIPLMIWAFSEIPEGYGVETGIAEGDAGDGDASHHHHHHDDASGSQGLNSDLAKRPLTTTLATTSSATTTSSTTTKGSGVVNSIDTTLAQILIQENSQNVQDNILFSNSWDTFNIPYVPTYFNSRWNYRTLKNLIDKVLSKRDQDGITVYQKNLIVWQNKLSVDLKIRNYAEILKSLAFKKRTIIQYVLKLISFIHENPHYTLSYDSEYQDLVVTATIPQGSYQGPVSCLSIPFTFLPCAPQEIQDKLFKN